MFKATARKQTPASFKPCLESLEDRCLLDGNPQVVQLQTLYSLIGGTNFLGQATAEVTRQAVGQQLNQLKGSPDPLIQAAQEAAFNASVPSLQQAYNNLNYLLGTNPNDSPAVMQAEADFIGSFMGFTPQQAQAFLNNSGKNPQAAAGVGEEAVAEGIVKPNQPWYQPLLNAYNAVEAWFQNGKQGFQNGINKFKNYFNNFQFLNLQGSSQNSNQMNSSSGETLVYDENAPPTQNLLS